MVNTRSLTNEERFELVLECRNSGLSDYQWCREHEINPGTFYNWIARFRKKGYPNIPEPTGKTSNHKALKQDVVKVDVLPDTKPESNNFGQYAGHHNSYLNNGNAAQAEPVIEICSNGSIIRMTNNISPQLFSIVLEQLGGIK